MLAVTILLCVMAVVNLVFIATATALDAQTSLAVTRALGATPAATTGALATAQALPAAAGVVLGIPAGLALFAALDHGGQPATPPVWWLVSLGCLAVVVTAALRQGYRTARLAPPHRRDPERRVRLMPILRGSGQSRATSERRIARSGAVGDESHGPRRKVAP